jgi:hypothetical protein
MCGRFTQKYTSEEPVSRRVNKAGSGDDDPTLIDPIAGQARNSS